MLFKRVSLVLNSVQSIISASEFQIKNHSSKNYWDWFSPEKLRIALENVRVALAELLKIMRLRSELCNSCKKETVLTWNIELKWVNEIFITLSKELKKCRTRLFGICFSGRGKGIHSVWKSSLRGSNCSSGLHILSDKHQVIKLFPYLLPKISLETIKWLMKTYQKEMTFRLRKELLTFI